VEGGPDLVCGIDPGFALEPVAYERATEILSLSGLVRSEPIIGVAIRGWRHKRDSQTIRREIAAGLETASRKLGARILFIPMQRLSGRFFEDDFAEAERTRKHLSDPDRAVILNSTVTPNEVASVIGLCRVAVSMRLHAAIFAVCQSVPVVTLSYDPKLLRALGEGGFSVSDLPISTLESEKLAKAVVAASARSGSSPGFEIQRLKDGAREHAQACRRILDQVEQSVSRERTDFDGLLLAAIARAGELDSSLARLSSIQMQRDRAIQQRNRLERDLQSIRSTLGFRLLETYWSILRRLMPEGTFWREAYRVTSRYAHRLRPSQERGPTVALSQGLPRSKLPYEKEDIGSRRPGIAARAVSSDPRIDMFQFSEDLLGLSNTYLFSILSTTGFLTSEGQRPVNISLALSDRRIPVVYAGWRWEAEDFVLQDTLDIGILQFPIDLLLKHPDELVVAAPHLQRVLLVSFPHPSFLPLLAQANGAGWVTIYDVMDDWEAFHEVGQAPWFDPSFERHLMNAADLVTAVSPALAGKVRAAGRSEVELLPNAVHATAARIVQPVDLERGDRTVGYFGHLSEAWFDWDLLVETAVLRPNWRFYIIGYGGPSAKRHVPENIVLLGRQPRDRLAAFAANWDAAMVPFKPGPLAEGVDAIKIYEYLAMGLPVVATGIQPPVGAEIFVHRVEGRSAFLDGLETACGAEPALRDSARRYAAKQLWSTRVDQLLACLAEGAQGVAIKRAVFLSS